MLVVRYITLFQGLQRLTLKKEESVLCQADTPAMKNMTTHRTGSQTFEYLGPLFKMTLYWDPPSFMSFKNILA